MLRLFDHRYGKEYFHRTFKSICKRGVRRIDKLRPLLAFSLSRGQTKHESQLPQRATEQCGNQHSLTVVVFVWFSSCHWKCSGAVVVLQKNRFLASLCVADFLVGLVIDPTWIAIRFSTQPQRTHILKQVINLLWIHTTAATVFNLCCVSVDRFIAICFPFRYHDIITRKRCYAVIIMVWLISMFLPFSRILVDNRTNIESLWFSLTFITFVLPITIVTLCYFSILKAARRQANRINRENVQNTSKKNCSGRAIQNYNAIKTIGFVLGVFIVSWMPSLVVSVVDYVTASDKCVDHKLAYVVWPWIEAIAFTSSAINPWIYCFRNREFRDSLRLNCHRCSCRY